MGSAECHTELVVAEPWPLIGREAEVRALTAALTGPEPQGVLISGEAGVGKTRLVYDVLHGPRDKVAGGVGPLVEGVHLIHVPAGAMTSHVPFGALAHLLSEALPARANLVGWAGQQMLGDVPDGRRPVVWVDDPERLDALSATVIEHLARTRVATVVLTVRSDPLEGSDPGGSPRRRADRASAADLLEGDAVHLDLGPLSPADFTQLLEVVLAAHVETATAQRMWQVTGGNPMFLRELLGAVIGTGLVRQRGVVCWRGPVPVDNGLGDLVGERLRGLTLREREVLELVALGGPLPVEVLESLTDGLALESVEAGGLIVLDGAVGAGRYRVGHPLYGEVVAGTCPSARRRDRLRALAAAMESVALSRPEDLLRLVVWRLECGERLAPDQALTACRHALQAGDLPLSARLARAALEAGGGVPAAVLLATVLTHSDEAQHAVEVLAGAARGAMTDAERADLASARAFALQWGLGDPELAEHALEDALSQISDPQAREELRVRRGLAAILRGAPRDVPRWLEPGLAPGDLHPATRLLSQLLEAGYLGLTGRHAPAVASFDKLFASVDWDEVDPFEEIRAVSARHLIDLLAGHVDEAEAVVLAAHARVLGHRHWEFGTGCLGWSLGQTALLWGRVESARTRLAEAAVLLRGPATASGLLPGCLGDLARATALAGDAAAAQDALAEAEALRTGATGLYDSWIEVARPWVLAASGLRSAAVDAALEAAEQFRGAGLVGFEVIARHDALRLGGAGRGAGGQGTGGQVVERLAELVTDTQGPYPMWCARHARAVADGDLSAMTRVAEAFAAQGLDLLAADVGAGAAHLARRRGEPRTARRLAWSADQLRLRCEGAQTPLLDELRAPGLTPREHEVARLAATGLTSRQVADRIRTSVRTVDNHLHAVYAKLGVTDRHELARLLGADSARSPGTPASPGTDGSPGLPVRRPTRAAP